MSVKVEEEWRYKKVKSELASRSAFAFRINKELKQLYNRDNTQKF